MPDFIAFWEPLTTKPIAEKNYYSPDGSFGVHGNGEAPWQGTRGPTSLHCPCPAPPCTPWVPGPQFSRSPALHRAAFPSHTPRASPNPSDDVLAQPGLILSLSPRRRWMPRAGLPSPARLHGWGDGRPAALWRPHWTTAPVLRADPDQLKAVCFPER